MILDGTHDTIIPYEASKLFFNELEGQKKSKGIKGINIMVGIPYARHAFNVLINPLTFALSDATLIFIKKCFQIDERKKKLNEKHI